MGAFGSGRTPHHLTVEQCERLVLGDVLADVTMPRGQLVAAVRSQGRAAAGLLDLDATPMPRGGGWRLWLVCPVADCRRRCTALYWPPGARRWACRVCAELTYDSCQASDHRLALARYSPSTTLGLKQALPAEYRAALRLHRWFQR